ncbi:MAG: hypothetical protein IT538_04345 [Variibacter sp.]|nr:hypothetical protein [Variibacter sp.]
MHPLFHAFLRECRRTLLLLAVYGLLLAGLGFGGMQVYAALPADPSPPPAQPAAWVEIPRPQATFALEFGDFIPVQPHWMARRHSEGGGRRDLLMWEAEGPQAAQLTLEFYRPGREPIDEADMQPNPADEPLGGQDEMPSKFGPFALSPPSPASAAGQRCRYFHRHFDEPPLRITGMACAKADEPRLREMIACSLDRLSLTSAGGDARLAGLFARAELKRSTCGPGRLPTAAIPARGAWIDSLGGPALRR